MSRVLYLFYLCGMCLLLSSCVPDSCYDRGYIISHSETDSQDLSNCKEE